MKKYLFKTLPYSILLNNTIRFLCISSIAIASSSCNGNSGSSDDLGNNLNKEKLTVTAIVYGLNQNEHVTLVDGKNQKSILVVSSNGKFAMPEKVIPGSPYQLTVLKQPGSQTCTVDRGDIVALDNSTNFILICNKESHKIKVKVEGLAAGMKLKLLNHGSKLNDIILVSSDGTYEFSQAVAHGGTYDVEGLKDTSSSVSMKLSSENPSCQVTNGQGIAVNDKNIVHVICGITSVTIKANVTGLTKGESIQLKALPKFGISPINSYVTVSSNGTFYIFSYPTLSTPYKYFYDIQVAHSPQGLICTIDKPIGGVGSNPGSNATINITCPQLPNSNYTRQTLDQLIYNSLNAGMYYTILSESDINKYPYIYVSVTGAGGGGGGGGSKGADYMNIWGGNGASGGSGGGSGEITAKLSLKDLGAKAIIYWIVGSGGIGGNSFTIGNDYLSGNGGTGGGGGGASAIYYQKSLDDPTFHYLIISAGGGGGGGGGGGHMGFYNALFIPAQLENGGFGAPGGNGGDAGNCIFPENVNDYSQKTEPMVILAQDGNVGNYRNSTQNLTYIPQYFGPGQIFSGLQGGNGGYSNGTEINGTGGGAGGGAGAVGEVAFFTVPFIGGGGGGGGGQIPDDDNSRIIYPLPGYVAGTSTFLQGGSVGTPICYGISIYEKCDNHSMRNNNHSVFPGGAGGAGGSGAFSWVPADYNIVNTNNYRCRNFKTGGSGGDIGHMGTKGIDGLIGISI